MAMTPDPTLEKTLDIAKAAQLANFVRENQILTALCLFVLWQTGAFLSAFSHAQGAIC